MKTYSYRDAPLRVFGVLDLDKKDGFCRLNPPLLEALPNLSFLGRRCPGARLCFRTDSKKFTVHMQLESMSPDLGIGIFGCQSGAVFIGQRSTSNFVGVVYPKNYEELSFSRTFTKRGEMEEITIFLPRNEVLVDIRIEVEDGARVEAPTPYQYGPVVFYGSSITEGGCGAGFNSYEALLSRWLDMDFYNLGFSGNARGEQVMADFIAGIPDMRVFVLDYDHNAPTVAHLEETHEPFFKTIRAAHPHLPILMMTRPRAVYTEDDKKRREVVRRTYENAVAAGDRLVRFIDGETFFGTEDRTLCTVDNIHPNDLGFYRMATVIRPVMEELLALSE